jgi:hypothetical protein
MKKLIVLLTFSLLALGSSAQYNFGLAGTTFGDMDTVTYLNQTDRIPIVQEGRNRTVTWGTLQKYNGHATSVAFLVSQSGTSDPTWTILFDEFEALYPGINWTWTRQATGQYQLYCVSNSPFTVGKTFFVQPPSSDVSDLISFTYDFPTDKKFNLVIVDVQDGFSVVDNQLDNTLIIISVYP